MHIVTICFRQSPTTAQFIFREFTAANAFRQAIHKARGYTEHEDAMPADAWSENLRDDFGKTLDVMLEEIGAVIMVDTNESTKGGVELQLANMHGQIELQRKVQADPKFKFMQGMQLPPGGLLT